MIKFKKFITEAKVSQARIEKVLDIFVRLIEKKINSKLHRFGGPKGEVSIKNGVGYLFIARNKKAFRFNYVRGSIASITIWKQFKLGRMGDFTLDLDDIGLLQAGKKLIDLVVNPKIGSHLAFANPDLNEETLMEASRITPEDFFNLVSKNLPSGAMLSAMKWDDIVAIASDADKQIPSVVRDVKSGKGRTATFDLTKLVDAPTTRSNSGGEKDYYIKITAQDRTTKSFVSVKGDKKAEEMLSTIRGSIQNPDVKEEMKNPDTLFGIMRNLTQLVCRKSRNSLIIYGGPGIGKTFTVLQTLKDEGLTKNKDYFIVKGKITTVALYQQLFMHRQGSVLVFDDTDSVWGDQDAANVLKAALDSYDERTISWYSNRTVNISKMSDAEKEDFFDSVDTKIKSGDVGCKLPAEFPFNGRIIFISNLDKSKFDSAVLTRSAKVDMTLTDEQIFFRMQSILQHLGDKNVPMDVKDQILGFLKKRNQAGLLSGPSMRTYVAAEDLYKSGLDNWQELLDYV